MAIELKPLADQVVVITGASSGIGLATALLAAEQKARVVLAARSADTLQEVVADIRQRGGSAEFVETDVAQRDELERLAEHAVQTYGRIDTWVNDAGVSIFGRLDEVSEADSRRLFDINFWGVVNGSLVALPHLRRNGGALINLGSEVSEAALPLQGIYTASKHAVKGFTDALRVELSLEDQQRVSVTLIQPGATDTPYPQNARNYMDREPKLPSPLDKPEHVAAAILDAAQQPTREVRVSLLAKLDTTMWKNFPALAEKFSKLQAGRQQYDEAPRDPQGTLHQAGESGRVRGSGPRESEANG